MRAYERLDAWRRAHDLVRAVYQATQNYPTGERFGLTSQSRRAAISIAANIAEASAKRGPAEFARFLDIAIGSLNELAYLVRLGNDLGYLNAETYEALSDLRDQAGRLTWQLYRSLRRRDKRRPQPEPEPPQLPV